MVGWRNWVGNWPDANRVAQDPKKSNGWLFSKSVSGKGDRGKYKTQKLRFRALE